MEPVLRSEDNINRPAGTDMADVYSNSLKVLLEELGPDHDDVALIRIGYAGELQRKGETKQARKQLDEALRIAVLNHGIYSAEAFEALQKIRQLVKKGSREYVRLTEAIKAICPVMEELRITEKWWARQLRTNSVPADDLAAATEGQTAGLKAPSEEQVEAFEKALLREMVDEWSMHLDKYWVHGDSNACKVALAEAGINRVLPLGTGTIVKVGSVVVYQGGFSRNGWEIFCYKAAGTES